MATDTIPIPSNGEFGEEYRRTIPRKRQTKFYYIMAMDCSQHLWTEFPLLPKIEVQVRATNAGSHFSQEDSGIFTLSIIMLLVFTALLCTTAYNYFKQAKEDLTWVHPQVILMASILVEVCHLTCLVIHYWVYYYDGEGIFVFKVFALINKVVAQVLLIWMLLMMAYGWTISYDDLKDKDIYIIILCFVVMIHMMITGLTFIDYGEAYKYHDFGGVQGFILIFL